MLGYIRVRLVGEHEGDFLVAAVSRTGETLGERVYYVPREAFISIEDARCSVLTSPTPSSPSSDA